MLNFFKKLFSQPKHHSPIGLIDEKYDCIEVRKNKLPTEEKLFDEIFYVHDSPTPYPRNKKMPSKIEQADNINTNQIEMIDQKTGKTRIVSASDMTDMQEKVPDGINIPGLGKVGGKKPQRPPQGQQRPPQGQQQRPSPQGQQQRPPQQQPPAGYQQQAPAQAPAGYEQAPVAPQQPYQQPAPQYHEQPYNVVPNGYPPQQQQVPVNQAAGQYLPPSEIAMIEGSYHVFVDLAGVSKESLKVHFNAGTLVVGGERKGSVLELRKKIKGPRGRKDPILTEHNTVPPFLVGKFEFKYPFQRLVDESKLSADMENGILHVELPHRVKGEEVSIPIM